jgi:hypothetical protein
MVRSGSTHGVRSASYEAAEAMLIECQSGKTPETLVYAALGVWDL